MKFINDASFSGLQYITADNIHSPSVSAIFSTRNGGVSGGTPETEYLRSMNLSLRFSSGEEDYGNAKENYKIIISSQGFKFNNLVTLRQKHTSNIVVVDERVVEENRNNPFGFNRLSEAADAIVTNIQGLLLSVRTADCVPILLYDPKTKSIGAAHAGWRGTLAGVGRKTVECMADVYGSNPKDIKAAIGPAIGVCCFEVGFEVLDGFIKEYGDDIVKHFTTKYKSKPYCDIKLMNKAFLIEAGIFENNIDVSDLCTKCNPDLFYSARYSGEKYGSLAGFIGLKNQTETEVL
ncbi:MAG: peptidoglycan editing factor PgeF [Defluviitaleaceae bacterium]|nr:peptidoglycan editing factor PgeF [Defluviitaleaceae bacterium]